jgi:hypothetical protein
VLEGGEWPLLPCEDIGISGDEAPSCFVLVLADESEAFESCDSLERCNLRKVDVERRRISLKNFMS